ncbi:hypothetical protein EMCRGX_G003493 [Ephydatia muelleri]
MTSETRKDPSLPVRQRETPLPVKKRETPFSEAERDPFITSEAESDPSTSEREKDTATSKSQRPLSTSETEKDASLPVRQRETPLPVRQRKMPLYQERALTNSEARKDPSLPVRQRETPLPVRQRKTPLSMRQRVTPLLLQSDHSTNEAERETPLTVRQRTPLYHEADINPSTSEARQRETLSISETERDPSTSEADRDQSLPVRQKEIPPPVRQRVTPLPVRQKEIPPPVRQRVTPLPVRQKEIPLPVRQRERPFYQRALQRHTQKVCIVKQSGLCHRNVIGQWKQQTRYNGDANRSLPLPPSPIITYGNSLLHVCLGIHVDMTHTLCVFKYWDLSLGLLEYVLNQSAAPSWDDQVYLLLEGQHLTHPLSAVNLMMSWWEGHAVMVMYFDRHHMKCSKHQASKSLILSYMYRGYSSTSSMETESLLDQAMEALVAV